MSLARQKKKIKRRTWASQYNEARSGHGLKDEIYKKVLRETAQQWKEKVGILQQQSAKMVARRCGATLAESTLVVPTQAGFLQMYDWEFWCRWNPMDWCYRDAVNCSDLR